jgi:Ran GTPase-activating protein (RanGAP) involved in mRNA processing and transport
MSAYAVSLSTLPEDCIKQCIKAGNSHKLLQVSKTLQRLTKDTARDVVLQASAGEEFPEGEGLLKKLQGIPRLWHITVLRLRDCKLCCQGGIELAKFLYGNTTLLELDVSKNQLREKGGKAICNALRKNTTLENLNISRNEIGNHIQMRFSGMRLDRTQDFARLLRGNVPLKSLDISHNRLTYEDICDFAAALDSRSGNNTTLTSLAIGGHDLSFGAAEKLAETLRHNTTLTRLDLREATLTMRGVASLETAVKANTTLRELDLRSVQGEGKLHNLLEILPVMIEGSLYMMIGGSLYSPRRQINTRIIV